MLDMHWIPPTDSDARKKQKKEKQILNNHVVTGAPWLYSRFANRSRTNRIECVLLTSPVTNNFCLHSWIEIEKVTVVCVSVCVWLMLHSIHDCRQFDARQTYHHHNTHVRSAKRHDRSQRSHSSYSHNCTTVMRVAGTTTSTDAAALFRLNFRCAIFDTWIHNQFRIRDRLPYLGTEQKKKKEKKRWQQNELCICSLHR